MSQTKQNLLFVMTDHQRADSLGMVQAGVEVAPNLDRLAERGAMFTRAYSTCPLCVPARTALATGKYPTRTGVLFNDWKGTTAQDHKPLHQFLFEEGYDVAHVGVDHIRLKPSLRERVPFAMWASRDEYYALLKRRGMGLDGAEKQSFQRLVFENQEGRPRQARYSNTKTAVWPHPAEDFLDLYLARKAIEFLEQERDRPFALFLYLWAPHPPLRVPEPYASMFDPLKLDLPDNVGCPASSEPPKRRSSVPAQLAAGVSICQWREVWAAHLGLVHLADEGIGNVLKALEATGQRENTFVLFTADHGEQLGQHAMYQKMEMYEQALRVPLLICGPEVSIQRVDRPVSHLDVMPTVLDLLDVAAPDDLDGTSLVGSVLHRQPPAERPVFAQYSGTEECPVFAQYSGNPGAGDTRRCVVTGRYKYVFDPEDTAELYDLEADPLEMTNLAQDDDYRVIRERLHEACRVWGMEHADPVFAS